MDKYTKECVCGGSVDDPNDDCERCQLIKDLAAKDAEIARLTAEVDSLYAQLEATRIEYSRKVTRTFNEGYYGGHHDTVEGLYVDIHESDMDSYKHN